MTTAVDDHDGNTREIAVACVREMAFTGYIALQKNIEDRYGWAYHKYPLTMGLLDLSVRCLHTTKKEYDKAVNAHCSFSLALYIYRLFLSVATRVLPKRSSRQVYYSLPGFDFAESCIAKYCEDKKISHKSRFRISRFQKLTDIILCRRPIFNFVLSSPSVAKFYRKLRRFDLDCMLNRVDLMTEMEGHIKCEISLVARVLDFYNITHLITLGDSDKDTVVAAAAGHLKIPYSVLAHGYIVNHQLLSIAPIRAAFLIVWSRQQMSDLKHVLSASDAEKVRFIGFPKVFEPSSTSLGDKKIALLILSATKDFQADERFISLLNSIFATISRFGLTAMVRLHPKERNNVEKRSDLKQIGYRLSDDVLEHSLRDARFVIGYDSSVLVEASNNGIPVLQLEDLLTVKYFGIPTAKVADLGKWIASMDLASNESNRTPVLRTEFELGVREFLQDCES